jgi:hypothetical protein
LRELVKTGDESRTLLEMDNGDVRWWKAGNACDWWSIEFAVDA